MDDEHDMNIGDIADKNIKGPGTPKNKGKGKMKAPLSEANVRRSLRLKKINKGFKSSSCKDKSCLGYSSKPPTITLKMIRNLGVTFCDINPEDLSPTNLNAKPMKKKRTVSKKQTVSNTQATSSSGQSSKKAISSSGQGSKPRDADQASSYSGQSSNNGVADPNI